MTKITDRLDEAAVAAQVFELDQRRAVDVEALSPLDHDSSLAGELFEAKVAQLRAVLDPIQVDMGELHASRVNAHQLERWAGYGSIGAGALRDAADECRLSGAKLADQQHHVAFAQRFAKALPHLFGFCGRVGGLAKQSGRSPCARGRSVRRGRRSP